jgi:hypothetical protein
MVRLCGREHLMEHIREPLRRIIETTLDDLVDLVISMPEGEERDEWNRRINQLEEELLHHEP